MDLDLNKLRDDINEVDREIVDLFKKRMEIAASVAKYKKENNLPVLDAARERALLSRISDMPALSITRCSTFQRRINTQSLIHSLRYIPILKRL